jgi:DNA-binding MarR family transcriptional regulator
MAQTLGHGPTYATFSRLVRVQTALWQAVDVQLREQHNVTLAHVTALQVVGETPGCRVQDIVTTLHITVGGASKVVDRLVAAGHVERAANPTDRRSSVLTVTASGRELLARVAPDVDAVLADRLEAVLTEDDLVSLDRTLRLLETGRSAADEERAS